jgi:hypothetical protein
MFSRAQDAQPDGDDAKPKFTIKEITKNAHTDKLRNKVAAGEASDGEKQQLLDLYLSLLENKPPQGDAESWQKLSSAAVAEAARVVVGRDGAERQLRGAASCAACHREHKPPAER